jgi:FtsZ-binding cell division protein ZapB
MDDRDFHDARMRISRWIEEGAGLLGTVPGMLTEQERLRERLEATERASNRLLQEVNDLRRELDALQCENEGLRRERAELADVLADSLGRVLNETLPRLRAPLAPQGLPAEPSYS